MRLPLTLFGLAIVSPVFAACSASPDEPVVGASHEALSTEAAPQSLQSLKLKCEQEQPGCTKGGTVPWSQAVPPPCGSGVNPAMQTWVDDMQSAGCTEPVSIVFPPPPNQSFGGSVLFSLCPDWVELFPAEPGMTWAALDVCDACIPPPPPGFTNVVWGTNCMAPAGCRNTTCAGVPVY